MEPKKPSESYTESVQILNRSTMNGYDRLFGGKLMEWIDVIAAVVARRHSKRTSRLCSSTGWNSRSPRSQTTSSS